MTALSKSFWSSRSMMVNPLAYPRALAVPAQHAVADGMKRSAPESARVDRQKFATRSSIWRAALFVNVSSKDVARIDPVLEQVGDAIRQGARLARAGAGDDQQRTRRRRHRRDCCSFSSPA